MIIASAILIFDRKGVIFKQKRITKDYKQFTIYKFRTMKENKKIISKVTAKSDIRITAIGKYLRKTRLDELPQLFNVLKGEMSFVGTRPEVPEYVRFYNDEMLATLLLPAGITSSASIEYKNEAELLNNDNIEQVYINKILPEKMKINLRYLNNLSILQDIKIILKTII